MDRKFPHDFMGRRRLSSGQGLVLHQLESFVVAAAVEFATAIVAGDAALDRSHAVDDAEAVGADVGVVALHSTALEGQGVKWLFAGDAEIGAGSLPLVAVRIDVATPATLVGDQVGQFMLEGAPKLLGFTVAQFWI